MTTHITINQISNENGVKQIKRDMIIVDDMIYLDNPIFISATVKNMFGMELEIFIEDVEKNLESIIRMRELFYAKQREPELFTGDRLNMVRMAINQEIAELEVNGGVEIVAFDI